MAYIAKGQSCENGLCLYGARCRGTKCKCRNGFIHLKKLNTKLRTVWLCVERCTIGGFECPVHTTCLKVGSSKKYSCECSADAVRFPLGYCVAKNTTPSVSTNVTVSTTTMRTTKSSNSMAVTTGLAVGLVLTMLLAIILLVVIVWRRRKRRRNDNTSYRSKRSPVEPEMTKNTAYLNVDMLGLKGRDNLAGSTVDGTRVYEEVDLDLSNHVDGGLNVVSVHTETKQANNLRSCDTMPCENSKEETVTHHLCDLNTTSENDSRIQPALTGKENATAFQLDFPKQHEYQSLYDQNSQNEGGDSVQLEMCGSKNAKVFQYKMDSSVHHEYQALKPSNQNESSVQPKMTGSENPKVPEQRVDSAEQHEYHILCDVKTTSEDENSIQPDLTGSENLKVCEHEVDSAEKHEYHILCDLNTANENDSSVQPNLTGNKSPEVSEERVDSAEQHEYHILCDVKATSEDEKSVDQDLIGSENLKVCEQRVDSAEKHGYHILCDVKTTNENESSSQPDMNGSENPQPFQEKVDSAVAQNTNNHPLPGLTRENPLGREDCQYDELKLPKV